MDIIITTASLVALTTGLTEMAKRALKIPSRFVPLTAILAGIFLAILMPFVDYEFNQIILIGIAAGLGACGLFSGVKSTIGK